MIRDPLDVFIKDFAEDEEIVFEWENGDGEEVASPPIKAIFDDSFVDTATGETVLDTTAPRLTAKAADVADIPREAMVTIRGKAYSVTQIQPDGTGFAIVQLAHEA